MINELRTYSEIREYDHNNIADRLIELSGLKECKELKNDLENALYQLETMAQNKYNNDYYRTLYNVLLIITGMVEE